MVEEVFIDLVYMEPVMEGGAGAAAAAAAAAVVRGDVVILSDDDDSGATADGSARKKAKGRHYDKSANGTRTSWCT